MTNKINKVIVGAIKNIIDSYDNEAPTDASYPYAVISTTRLNIDDNISRWKLEINVWDKNRYYSRAESKADEIEKELDFKRLSSGSNLICLFKSQKDNIKDSDSAIKRVRIQIDMTIYESEE